MPQIIVNRKLFYKVEKSGEIISENGNVQQNDIVRLSKYRFHAIREGKGYLADVKSVNERGDTMEIEINGRLYTVKIKSEIELLTEKLGMKTESTKSEEKEVVSPMPGMIIQIKVKEGDEVKEGSALLVLKAMKMENIIKSPRSGRVTKVLAREGSSVEKNQALIEF